MERRCPTLILLFAALLSQIALGCSKPADTNAAAENSRPRAKTSTAMNLEAYPPIQVKGVGPWVVYKDPRAALEFTFEYPNNWALGAEEGRKEPYWQLIILGPRNADNSFSTTLTVRRLPTRQAGGYYKDSDALIESRRNQYRAKPGFNLISEGKLNLRKVSGWQLSCSYLVPLPSNSVKAKPTRLQTQLFQFTRQDQLYEVIFTSDALDYATYLHVFNHLLDSLHFNKT